MSEGNQQGAALSAEIMAAFSNVPPGRVRVTGDGALAQQLRSQGLDAETERLPLAVVETTGLGAELSAACAEVADGGLVLLAAEGIPPVDIDLYRHVHRRGLVLVGVSGRRPHKPSGDDVRSPDG
jgi:hypothetical protein